MKDAWAYPVVEFDAIESDTTKLQLTISSLLPDDIKLAVDVVPGVSEIVFPESLPESLMIWRWKGISCHRKRRKIVHHLPVSDERILYRTGHAL